jgi:putative transposase
MPRSLLIRSDSYPYHITARVNHREAWPIPIDRAWSIWCRELHLASCFFGFEIHAFVMMPNHIHLLGTTPDADLGRVSLHLMKRTSQQILAKTGRKGHLYGGPHHRNLILTDAYFATALKYVYRNPVEARICKSVTEYEYSTLQVILGNRPPEFPLAPPRAGLSSQLPSETPADWLEWLAEPFPHKLRDQIASDLRRKSALRILSERSSRRLLPTPDF